jgi:hypothetical protein
MKLIAKGKYKVYHLLCWTCPKDQVFVAMHMTRWIIRKSLPG